VGLRSPAATADTGWATPSLPRPRPRERHRDLLVDHDRDGERPAPAVMAREVRVVTGDRLALRGIDFGIDAGRVTGVIGAAGAGKTTLLDCILGAQRPSSGELTVLGRPAGAPDLRGRVVRLTPASLYGDLTVAENLRYFGRVLGAPARLRDEVTDRLGLGPVRGDLVDRVSVVARRTVAVATALLGAPELLLLDDFVTGVDPARGEGLWRDLHALAAEGLTVVVTSPTLDVAACCSRIVVLRDGDLLADDTPAGVCSLAGTGDLDEAVVRLARQRDALGEHAR
jgi:ABC-2 type transport system ATP-binding protein